MDKARLVASHFWLLALCVTGAMAHGDHSDEPESVAHSAIDSESQSTGNACALPSALPPSASSAAIPSAVLRQLVGVWRGDTASIDVARFTRAEQGALAELAPVFEIAINARAEGLFVADLFMDGQRSPHALPAALGWGYSASTEGHLYVTNTQRPGEILMFEPPGAGASMSCVNCADYGMPTNWMRVSQ